MDEQDPLAWLLAAWRADIDSVSLPELLSVDAAVAVMAAVRRRKYPIGGLTVSVARVTPGR